MEIFEDCGQPTEVFSRVLSCLRHGVLICQRDGRIRLANQACQDILGYEPSALEDRNLSMLFLPDDLDCLFPNLMHLAGHGQPFAGEVMLGRKDGRSFFAYLTLETVAGEGGGFLVAGVEDIDEFKQLNKIVDRSNFHELLAIADGIAHELRNPLMGIGGFVNRLYHSCQIDVDNEQYYHFIMQNVGRIEALVRKVKDLASLPPPELAPHTAPQLVEEAASPFRAEIRDRKVNLSQEVDKTTILVDQPMIVKGLGFLFRNTLDVLPPAGGNIWVESGRINGAWRLKFADDGPGIRPDDLPNIFNPFFTTKADGAGIDLALLRRIMETHGGSVQAASELGHGTTFTLELPLERRRSIRVHRLAEY